MKVGFVNYGTYLGSELGGKKSVWAQLVKEIIERKDFQDILMGGSKLDIWVWKERCEHIYGGGKEHGVIYLHGAE